MVEAGIGAQQRNKAAVELGAFIKKGTLDLGYLDDGAPQAQRAVKACKVGTDAYSAFERQQVARKLGKGMSGP